ncbi:MAG: phosphohistidine phosphatase SixA [Acidobacteria bacterium]|nr:phosphohistidine phosphatase SixA [Acidobacteriota bacterium]
MEIYLLRHAIAEDWRPGMADADRALTVEGKKRLRAVLRLARAAAVEPSLILSSPYVRARDTAAIAAEELHYRGTVIHTGVLTPDGNVEAVWTEIRTHLGESSVLLAGHEPLLGRMAGYLLGAPGVLVEMKKSALVRIDVNSFGPAPRGVLRWMLTPALAR